MPEPERRTDFSQALGAATYSHVGAVMVHDPAHAPCRLHLPVGADPAQMAAYKQEFAIENPWTRRGLQTVGPGRSWTAMPCCGARTSSARATTTNTSAQRCRAVGRPVCANRRPPRGNGDRAGPAACQPTPRIRWRCVRRVAPHWANAYAIQRRMSWLEQRVRTLEEGDRLPAASAADARRPAARSADEPRRRGTACAR